MGVGANFIVGGDVDRLRSGRLDYPFMPTKTQSYTEGIMLECQGQVGSYETTFTPQFDIELYAVAIGCSKYQARDHWSMYIGEKTEENLIKKNIYTKNVPEGMNLMAVRTIPKGTPITVVFNNEGGHAKFVWLDFQCLRDPVE